MENAVLKTLVNPLTADKAYIHEVGQMKRALELWTMEPGWQKKFMDEPEKTLTEHGLTVDVLSVKIFCDKKLAEDYQNRPLTKWPRAAARYRGFLEEKIAEREKLARELCVPLHPAISAWRKRQQNRCWVELGLRNRSIIHVTMNYELDLGCSVGCPFCGVMAPKLSRVCKYDAENARLWQNILAFSKETIGPAAGWGTCYYATEPLDNPDYEKFADDFYAVFGVVPQLTTAAAMRNPERTKVYLEKARGQYRRVHRFSVLSRDILHKIYEHFTMDELVSVELLPQFAEAPASHFAKAGRAREGNVKTMEEGSGNTIACITGFVVNMAERSLRLITPCESSADRPTGEILIAKAYFRDMDDFKELLLGMIEKYMLQEFPKSQPLVLRPGIEFAENAEGITFSRPGLISLKFRGNDDIAPQLYHCVLRELKKGAQSAREIAGNLLEQQEVSPAQVFYVLKKFEQAGLFLEPYEVPA